MTSSADGKCLGTPKAGCDKGLRSELLYAQMEILTKKTLSGSAAYARFDETQRPASKNFAESVSGAMGLAQTEKIYINHVSRSEMLMALLLELENEALIAAKRVRGKPRRLKYGIVNRRWRNAGQTTLALTRSRDDGGVTNTNIEQKTSVEVGSCVYVVFIVLMMIPYRSAMA